MRSGSRKECVARCRRSWRDGDRGQILEPALCLDKAVHLGRERARVQVVCDEDQRRLLAHQLIELGEKHQALFGIELAEDVGDQFVDVRVAKMTPIGALWRPGARPNMTNKRIKRALLL